jgi:hypothetical protein
MPIFISATNNLSFLQKIKIDSESYLFCCETEALGEDALDDADDDDDEDEDEDVEDDDMDMWLYLRLTEELSHNAIECRLCTFSAEYWARSFTTEIKIIVDNFRSKINI